MNIGFDLISDLNINQSNFDWSGKPTSLYCIVPGNISSDIGIVEQVLKKLSEVYHGVFYIDGSVEVNNINFRNTIVADLEKICGRIQNVVYLFNNVVVVDGVAIVGINGWYNNYLGDSHLDEFQIKCNRYEDYAYLEKTIQKLQLHVDVKKIVVLTNCVPSDSLYFGEAEPDDMGVFPTYVLEKDTEHKVSHWVFGTYKKEVDTIRNNVNFVNNGKFDREPYYAKRIEVII